MNVGTLLDERDRVVCERCEDAARSFDRIRGLMGRRSLEQGQGMLIRKSSSIHTFFMHFRIDAVFLDRELQVRKIVPNLARRRLAFGRGRHVLELPAGAAARAGLEIGNRLSWREPSPVSTVPSSV